MEFWVRVVGFLGLVVCREVFFFGVFGVLSWGYVVFRVFGFFEDFLG